MTTKVGISLADDDLAFIDEYARSHGMTRSGAITAAIVRLRTQDAQQERRRKVLDATDRVRALNGELLERLAR